MKKSVAIGLRVDPQVKRAAEVAAHEDHRTVASLLNKLLVQHLIECGYLSGKASVPMGDDLADLELVTGQSHRSD